MNQVREVTGVVLAIAALMSFVLLVGTGDELWLATAVGAALLSNWVSPLRRRFRR